MTRPGRYQSSVAYALALIMAITGLAGVVGVSTGSAAAQTGPQVSVSCSDAIGGGAEECVISASGADQLFVPAANLCASLTSTSGSFDGTNYVSPVGSPSISFTFSGPVEAGGGGTYSVSANGAMVQVSGAAILCSAPTAEIEIQLPSEDTGADTGEIGGQPTEAAPSEPEGTDAATTGTAVSTPPADVPVETVESTDGTGGDVVADEVQPAAVIVDPETTPETGVTPVPATVTVIAYQCDVDPGASDPASAGCLLVPGMEYSALDSDGSLGTATTNASGAASFVSTVGNAFHVTQESVISGYRATGDGRFEIQQLTGDQTLVFINVLRTSLGRLQVVAGLCPTSTESRTEFTIADQRHFSPASLTTCGSNPGAVFTVTSPALPDGSLVIRTEADGSWRGYVPAGTYQVTASDGAVSDEIIVIDDAVSVAVAVTYVHQDQGTLELQHYFCTEGAEGEYIAIDPAGAPDASCSAATASLTVTDELNGGSDEIYVGPNGSTQVALKPGLYRVTGPRGIASELVTITAEQTSVARVSTVVTTGRVMIYGLLCPAGNGLLPADPGAVCTAPASGMEIDINGPVVTNEVFPSGGVLASLPKMPQGAYQVVTGSPLCGVQDGSGANAIDFAVLPGQTTVLYAYYCPIDDGTGLSGSVGGGDTSGPSGGDGTGGTGANPPLYTAEDGSGADGTGGAALLGNYASNSHLLVRGLPSTGSGAAAPSDYWWPILLLVGAFGLMMIGRRQQQKAARQRVRVRRDR